MSKADLLKQLRAHHKEATEYWADNRKAWLEDAKFRAGDQWPANIKKERDEAGRPVIVSDKTEQYVRQVVNDGRQNRPAPKVSPVDDGGDVKVADGFKGLIRSICNKSNADQALDTALDHAAGNGYGFFRLITDYENSGSFNQEILVRRVRNPLAVMLSPHQEADGSDSVYGFVEDNIRKDEYKRLYPKAKITNFESDAFRDGWTDENFVRIVEYFYKVQVPGRLLALTDGTVCSEEDYARDQRPVAPEDPTQIDSATVPETGFKPGVEQERPVITTKVKWCRASGAEILEEKDWLGKYIPIIPVYGVERDVNGKVTYEGLIRPAKDEQRMYNFGRAGFAEHVSLSTKQPYIAAAGQLEGFEADWNEAHIKNIPVLHYNPVSLDGLTALPAPQKAQPSTIPAILSQDMQISEHGIQGAMGMYNASLGERSNEKSGKAIIARDRQSDVGTFHYHDNLNRAIRYLCRQLVDLAPKVIDTRRSGRLLGEDGKATTVMFDPKLGKPFEQQGNTMVYNLGAGEYDVDVEAGPSYTTKRQEASEAMTEMANRDPNLWRTHGDLIAKSQDWPNAEDFAKRTLLTMPPDLRKAIEDGEKGGPEAAARAEVQRIMDQAQQAIAQREQALQQAGQHIQDLERQLKSKDAEVQVKAYEAETERMQVLAPATPPEMVQAIVAQTVTEIMNQPVPQPSGPPPTPPPVMAPTDQPPPGGF